MNDMHLKVTTDSAEETIQLGIELGKKLKGGEVFELLSDLGGGKTTFVKGLNEGFGCEEPTASPSFTISFSYRRKDGKQMHHFDFYRLTDPGIMAAELDECIDDPESVVVIEWGGIVAEVLPQSRITVEIKALGETKRELIFSYPSEKQYIFESVKGEA